MPAVYPRKRKWQPREQENPDVHLDPWEQGADHPNYAAELQKAVGSSSQLRRARMSAQRAINGHLTPLATSTQHCAPSS